MTENKPKEERVERILNAAISIFLISGYDGASMNAIAQEAGLTKGGLYHHFSSKEEILIYVNGKFMEPVYEMMGNALSISSAEYALSFFIRKCLHHWENHQEHLKIIYLTLAKVLASTEMWPFMEEYGESVITFYQELLEKGIQNGEFKQHDTRSRATALFSAMDGITGMIVMNSQMNHRDISDQFMTVFTGDIKNDKL